MSDRTLLVIGGGICLIAVSYGLYSAQQFALCAESICSTEAYVESFKRRNVATLAIGGGSFFLAVLVVLIRAIRRSGDGKI